MDMAFCNRHTNVANAIGKRWDAEMRRRSRERRGLSMRRLTRATRKATAALRQMNDSMAETTKTLQKVVEEPGLADVVEASA